MRGGNDVDGDEFAHPPCRRRSRIRGGLYRAHVASDGNRNVAGANIFFSLQCNFGGLHHRIRRLDCADQSFGFDHAKGFHRKFLPYLTNRISPDPNTVSHLSSTRPYRAALSRGLIARPYRAFQ